MLSHALKVILMSIPIANSDTFYSFIKHHRKNLFYLYCSNIFELYLFASSFHTVRGYIHFIRIIFHLQTYEDPYTIVPIDVHMERGYHHN